jgi:hypothetical protein
MDVHFVINFHYYTHCKLIWNHQIYKYNLLNYCIKYDLENLVCLKNIKYFKIHNQVVVLFFEVKYLLKIIQVNLCAYFFHVNNL